jgi:hypothetical protein
MGRTWLSIPVGRTGIRIGRSIADAELHPRLPRWKRYKIAKRLRDAATAKGEAMTLVEAGYQVDEALDQGELTQEGNLRILAKGDTPEEAITKSIEAAAKWGVTLPRSAAEQHLVDKRWHLELVVSRLAIAIAVVGLLVLLIGCSATQASAACHRCPPPHQSWFYAYPGDQVRQQDVFRYGPPELGGYRYGGKVNGRYMDDTVYRD